MTVPLPLIRLAPPLGEVYKTRVRILARTSFRNMSTIGSYVTVDLNDGSRVSGWDLGETPFGVYVALDRQARHIRFIPCDWYQDRWWNHKDAIDVPGATRELYARMDATPRAWPRSHSQKLVEGINEALDKTDFNEIRRLQKTFDELRNRFAGNYERLELKQEIGRGREADTVIETRLRYLDLIAELDRAGLLDTLAEARDELRDAPIPWFDLAYFAGWEDRLLLETMASKARETSEGFERDAGRIIIEGIRTDEIIDSVKETDEGEKHPKKDKESAWPKRLRILSATGKVALGSLLTTANIGAGVIAGVVTALPTLGMGAIAGAVGIATSAYTGLNAALDGVKDLAAAIETKPQSKIN